MHNYNSKINLICSLLIVFCVIDKSLVRCASLVLKLPEGSNCGGSKEHFVCKRANECDVLSQHIKKNDYLNICSFDRRVPIVCCPPKLDQQSPEVPITKSPTVGNFQKKSNLAVEKCRQYSALEFPKSDDVFISVVGGIEAKPQEFPHMAILGYGNTTANRQDWRCGGTLISERWILSAAHCHKMSARVQWARLGDLDIDSTSDDARPKDYRIVKHVIHPVYKEQEQYNDIALFQLETDVEFSAYVRPICLNADQSLEPPQFIATGWGKTASGETTSDVLLKVTLATFSSSQCNKTYFSTDSKKLQYGILQESMLCVGSTADDEDTCSGDSGGPIQTKHYDDYTLVYTQFGITSFGSGFCGIKNTPAVYTRVSKYITWIEGIVWPDS